MPSLNEVQGREPPVLGKYHAQVSTFVFVGNFRSFFIARVNAKLGGTNFVPDLALLNDPTKPTIIMGK